MTISVNFSLSGFDTCNSYKEIMLASFGMPKSVAQTTFTPP